MSEERSKTPPDEIAAIGSIVILTFLPGCLYSVLMAAVPGGVGGLLSCLLVPCANFIAASFFVLVILFPSWRLMNRLFPKLSRKVQEGNDRLLRYSGILFLAALGLVIASFAVGLIVLVSHPLFSSSGEQDGVSVIIWLLEFLYFGGVPFVLGGATYWFLLAWSYKTQSNSDGTGEDS